MSNSKNTSVAVNTKFGKSLAESGQTVLDKRAETTFKKTLNAVDDSVRVLERRMEELEERLLDLTDLSADTTDSLRPVSKDFDSKKWVANILAVKREIRLLQEDIDDAEEFKAEFFSPETEA